MCNINKRARVEIDNTISSFESVVITPKQAQIDYIDKEPTFLPKHSQINYRDEEPTFLPKHSQINYIHEEPTFLPLNMSDPENIDYNVEAMSHRQLTLIQQYITMLLKKQQLYHLEQISIIMFPDYCSTNGIISLKKQLIRIDYVTNLCQTCLSRSCVHWQVFEQCFFKFSHLLHTVELRNVKNVEYFHLNDETIIINGRNNDIHVFMLASYKWFCELCPKICKYKDTFETLLTLLGSEIATPTRVPIKYKSISSNSIPFSLNHHQSGIYEQQLFNGFQFPIKFIPEMDYCKNGHKFPKENLYLERKGLIVYLENDIRELKDHAIYSNVCNGHCQCKGTFNGENVLLLNLDNHYLIHYSLLYEYSELMTLSKNPLFSYIRAKNNKLARMRRHHRYKYHIVQHAWNAYIRSIDINYTSTFQCPTCTNKPPIIIIDGIAMGTTKLLPQKLETIDHTQRFPLIALEERIFIPNVKSRRALLEYADRGISEFQFNSMISALEQPEFVNYLRYTSEVKNELRSINPKYSGAFQIVKLLSRVETINAIFRFSAISSDQRKLILSISQGNYVSIKELSEIYNRMDILKILFYSIQPTIDNINKIIILHDLVAKLLGAILKKIQILITKPTRKLIEESPSNSIDFFSYFPALSSNYNTDV